MVVIVSMTLVACDPPPGDAPAVAPGPAPAPAVVVPAAPGNCVIGQIYNAQYYPTYGCLNQYTCPYGMGWVPNLNRCVPGTVITGPASGKAANFRALNMQVSRSDIFNQVLENARLCGYQNGAYAGGAACRNYSPRAYMVLNAAAAALGNLAPTASITLVAGAGQPGQLNPGSGTGGLVLSMTRNVNLAQTNGGSTNPGFYALMDTGVRVIVRNGYPSNSYQMNVELEYNGIVFATGLLTGY
jgi:hypothetical protein